ncbi:S9 family peptidase [Cellulomonas composti]|uniref:Dipeptidyl aminopeptidase n=1 Tax=Cellulomonas composti TaxID=266130 RepID=A0A511J8D9_9CELL|nr:S9 family peptidase [Cellulomonas composti]GEL94265.1 dipeptidyl aminopeptidase [Cellulomonas composti]
MHPDDVFLLQTPGRPAVLPDGSAAIVSVLRPDRDCDEYVGRLWRVPLDDGPVRPLTRGHRDTAPAVSPDGRWVVFCRAERGGRAQVHAVEPCGGEPLVLSDAPLGASAPAVSPDGRRVAFLAREAEAGRYLPGGDPAAEPPRLITELQYRGDGVGFTRDRPRRVHVVDLPDADAQDPAPILATVPDTAPTRTAVAVSPAGLDVSAFAWLPTGDALVAIAARHTDRERDLRNDVVVVPVGEGASAQGGVTGVDGGSAQAGGVEAGGLLPVTDADAGSTLSIEAVRVAEDGTRVWLLASDVGPSGRDFVAATTGLWEVRVDAAGRPLGPATRLTDAESVDLDPGVLLEVDGAPVVAPQRSGAVHLSRLGPDGLVDLVDGDSVVLGADAGGGRVVAAVARADSSGDLVVLDPTSGSVGARAPRRVTDLSAPLRATGRLRLPAPLVAHAPDGYRVEGWLTLPDAGVHGDGPYPTILMIHGGPFGQYTHALFDEVQVLAAAGYAVVHGNPRGSSGRGHAHGAAIRGAFGTVDADDVLALLDEALGDPSLDPARVGVMGGSYGGYLTAWLTTRTDRFAAAVVERGFLDPVSFVGSSDIGWFFGLEYLGDGADEAGAARVAAQSPMAHVGSVRTPTLVIHSEQDWRCPVEQGQRWFVELRRRGVPAELLLFPGEGHELTRSGRPLHRLQRFEHVLRWWGTHLPTGT